MVRPARFERATTCLEGRCSIQLSYGRNLKPTASECGFDLSQLYSEMAPWFNEEPAASRPPLRNPVTEPKRIQIKKTVRGLTATFFMQMLE